MNETNKKILFIIYEFIFLALLFSIVPIATYYDIVYMANDRLLENSATEWLQIFFLAVSAIAFFSLAVKDKDTRGLYALISSLFIAMIIRENDNFLDAVFHGFWKVLVVIAFVTVMTIVFKNKGTVLNALAQKASSRPFTFIMIGLIITLIFSRLFGTGELWNPALELLTTDARVATIKNIIQEGLELLGYSIIAYGSFLQTRLYK